MPGGKPPIYSNLADLEEAIESYFNTEAYMGAGDNRVFAPTMSGLAYHLGMCRQTLLNYKAKPQYMDTIKRARDYVAVALEQRLYGNNVTGIIFNLKNNFGWKDVKATELSGTDGNPIEVDQHWTIEVVD
jgi:hypothetical protein